MRLVSCATLGSLSGHAEKREAKEQMDVRMVRQHPQDTVYTDSVPAKEEKLNITQMGKLRAERGAPSAVWRKKVTATYSAKYSGVN